jgi:asparagine synthase (glutamine-hydrolysing)
MCGICGKLNLDRGEFVDRALLERMTKAIEHRGPDGGGLHIAGNVGLGHRRLSIIDLSTGDQPMCNEDGCVWVVFNGEIYNFAELRVELQGRGHQFKSRSDTEVIVHGYEEWGPDVVTRLRGMFAFAAWDARQETLLLARDRVGIKPLYYHCDGRSIVFGSELKAIIADGRVQRRVKRRAVDRFLTFGYLPGSETLIEGIHKLQPGHLLTVQGGRVETRQYWDLQFRSSVPETSFKDAVRTLDKLLARTVKDHLISDVPVGVLLSGGVDSSGVLSYAADGASRVLNTFTVGFSGASVPDERPYARLASSRYNCAHYETTISPQQFLEFLPSYVWHMEEPVCEPPAIALFFIAQIARQAGVKVLLSGEGGDEAFGGYKTYRNLLLLERLKKMFGPAKGLLRAGFSAASAVWPGADAYANLVDPRVSEYYFGRTATPDQRFDGLKTDLYKADMEEGAPKDEVTEWLFRAEPSRSALSHMLYVDSKSWLPDDLLVKADKMTMATATELRVPFLDYQVLEFAAGLPDDFKIGSGVAKRVLREALRTRVPEEVLTRKKAGFPVPYDRWLHDELYPFVSDTLLARSAALLDYFDREQLQKFVTAAHERRAFAKELFSLVVLELWHQKFMELSAQDVESQQVCASHG